MVFTLRPLTRLQRPKHLSPPAVWIDPHIQVYSFCILYAFPSYAVYLPPLLIQIRYASFMSARDLIGRPLVPFFDADENVNDALATDAGLSFETGDVDARVWNKELGYFEYPSDQTASSSDGSASNQRSASASKRGKGASSSAPIAIQSKKTPHAHAHSSEIDASNGSYGSASRMLLTPAMMLSSSCPDATSLANERDSTPQQQQPSGMCLH